jgi:mannose-1-phosphate guanylyltransferase
MAEMLSSWSDIGSFSSLYEVSPKDENLNFKHGKIIATKTKNSFLINDDSKISSILKRATSNVALFLFLIPKPRPP